MKAKVISNKAEMRRMLLRCAIKDLRDGNLTQQEQELYTQLMVLVIDRKMGEINTQLQRVKEPLATKSELVSIFVEDIL